MANLNFVSLFSGAGGLDIGFEEAGWHCVYATDIDKAAICTLISNRDRDFISLKNAVIEQRDVKSISGEEILSNTGRRRGDIVAIIGGPPCQSWSSAGLQLGLKDPRGRLFKDYLRIARELDVRWLVFENVRGLLTARGNDGIPGSALEHIRTELLQAGFQTEVELLNAADYGVPQRRVRLCMIGYRRGDRPPFPEATHAKEPHLFSEAIAPWRSLRDCLNSIDPPDKDEIILPNARLAEQLYALSPGTGVKSPGKAETTRPGGHWGYKQGAFVADLSQPARTITASAQQDWIHDPLHGLRRLTPRECAAIQTFPRHWIFNGTRNDQYRLIGNAVPPVLGKAIASSLRIHINKSKSTANPCKPSSLLPLRPHLISAINYTIRDGARNGESRKAVEPRRNLKK